MGVRPAKVPDLHDVLLRSGQRQLVGEVRVHVERASAGPPKRAQVAPDPRTPGAGALDAPMRPSGRRWLALGTVAGPEVGGSFIERRSGGGGVGKAGPKSGGEGRPKLGRHRPHIGRLCRPLCRAGQTYPRPKTGPRHPPLAEAYHHRHPAFHFWPRAPSDTLFVQVAWSGRAPCAKEPDAQPFVSSGARCRRAAAQVTA